MDNLVEKTATVIEHTMNLHECSINIRFRKDQLVKDPYFDKVGALLIGIITTKLRAAGKM